MIANYRAVRVATALCAFFFVSHAWGQPFQTVSTTSDVVVVPANNFLIEVEYNTSDGNQSLLGLGLRVHFNSARLSWIQNTFVNEQDLVGVSTPTADVEDFDDSPETDMFIQFAWASISGNWPGQLPAALAHIEFSTLDSFTGATINFSTSETSPGYGFQATQVLVGLSNSTIDFDNDGLPDECDAACLVAGFTADADDDNDGVADVDDAFPLDPTENLDTDSDGRGNNADTDDDNDGVADVNDAFPLDSTRSVIEETLFQTIGAANDVVAVPANNFDVQIVYNTSDGNTELPGLGLRVHFNSARLSWVQNTFVNEQDLVGVSTPTADVEDFDDSPETDMFIQFAWASISGNWPGQLPAALAHIEFSTLDSFTGATINFSTSETSPGYGFQATQVLVGLSNSTIDFDNDGLPDECDAACLVAGFTADADDDNDGVADVDDAFPLDPTENLDTDSDGRGNNADTDDDNDGVADVNDAFPLDSTRSVIEETLFQTIGAANDVVAVPANNFDVQIVYNTSDGNTELPGLGLRVHFNSARLSWVQNTFVNEQDLVGVSTPTADVEDFDNSPETDMFIQFAWASISGNWPGQLPAALAHIEFSTLDSFTGATINFSASETSPGYGFQATSVLVGLSNSTIDFDNDGLPDECDAACLAADFTADTDDDNDGVADVDDAFPLDPTENLDTDSDGRGNNADTDDDNDGVLDVDDAFPLDSTRSVIEETLFQTISAANDVVAVPANNFEVQIVYNTSDGNTELPGLGLRVHFNSARLSWVQNTFVNEQDLVGVSTPTVDVEDFDNSPETDMFIQFAWASISGNWPGQLPAALAHIEFSTLDSFTGATINFSASETSPGYGFQASPVLAGLSNSTIDFDNDGLPDECDAACLAAGFTADTDDDNDGVADVDDAFPLDPTETLDTDSDGVGNNADADDDNDGVLDVNDAFPLDPTRSVEGPNTAPTIAIEGSATVTLDVGEIFIDPGALAVDDEDGDLTSSVIVINPIDSSVPGSYTVEYRVTDSGGLTSAVTRTVTVIQPLSSGALRFAAGQVIELPVIGTALNAPNGDALVVPTTATAASINVTAVTPGGSGFITVWPCGVARPLASNLNYVAGDVVPNGVLAPIGSNGKVCLYSLVDTDLVVDVAGWFEGDAFVGATPLRLRDTRETSRVTSAQELVLQVADIDASTADGSATRVPADVGAVALNVTVVSPDSAGFVTVYPCGTRPLASNVNYTAGQIVPNGVIAPVSANGEVCIYSLAPTDIIVDLAGWFPGDAFTAATPQRLVDTRDGTGGQQGKLIPTGQLNVPVHGQTLSVSGNSAQVPLSATAAALNVTIVNPERAGFATVWPCSAERPLASNLNFVSGQVVANNVIAPIGDQGSVCFYTNVPSDIIVDIAGYFSGEAGNQFVGSTPKRYIDTRASLGPAPE